MGNYLNIGNDGFASVRRGIYVDKTELIAFINNKLGTKEKLICVSRPRRFGKSFTAQMLGAYYDKGCDSRALFEDLDIAEDPSFETHLNQYNVITLDMTFMIYHAKHLQDVIWNMEQKVIAEVCRAYPTVPKSDKLIETLANIAETTGNQFIVIIDEWDALFRETKNDTDVQDEYIRWLRGMFKSPLTDKAILGAYMTGILPIKKYGTQSAVSDFKEYTMLTPKRLAKYVGFVETEVRNLFAYISCVDEYMEIQELPSGIGYADVVFIPKKGSSKPAMVVELKWNKKTDSAIRQIKDRNYPQVLEQFTDYILLVGINYNEHSKKHSCTIEKFRKI